MIQLALASPGPPGQPDIITTRSTPSSPASRIVFDVTARCRAPDFAGMQRIARAVQRAERQSMIAQLRQELPRAPFAFQHRVQMQMRRARPVAARELQRCDAEFRRGAQQLVQGRCARLSVTIPIRMLASTSLSRSAAGRGSPRRASSSAFSPSAPSGLGAVPQAPPRRTRPARRDRRPRSARGRTAVPDRWRNRRRSPARPWSR